MRVISGILKGRRLASVRVDIRPTSDRLRESLFDVLGERVRGSVWIDLFAGTGAVGIEALSRGAASVEFVDRDREALNLVRKNLALCDIEAGVRLVRSDAFKFIATTRLEPPADFVFMDPPYAFGRHAKLLERVSHSGMMRTGTCLILEVGRALSAFLPPPALRLLKTIESGDSRLYLFDVSLEETTAETSP